MSLSTALSSNTLASCSLQRTPERSHSKLFLACKATQSELRYLVFCSPVTQGGCNSRQVCRQDLEQMYEKLQGDASPAFCFSDNLQARQE